MTRKIYLEDIPLDEAWRRLIGELEQAGQWQPLPGEEVPLDQALGRVTAAPVWARLSAPHYHASAMDGYAVRARDTDPATDTAPVLLELGPQAKYVDTGDPLPAWADAVVPIENVQLVEAPGQEVRGERSEVRSDALTSHVAPLTSHIELRASVPPWSHVRAMGEDMVATELVVPANHVLRPVDLGALAGSGHAAVLVRRKPRVAVIPTGTELVPAGTRDVKPGDIIEYNSLVLAAQVETWGGEATRWPIVPDDLERIRSAVAEAAGNHDLVLLNAGSSAGSEDFSAQVVTSLGRLLVHGVAVRPGHPVVIGVIEPQGARRKAQGTSDSAETQPESPSAVTPNPRFAATPALRAPRPLGPGPEGGDLPRSIGHRANRPEQSGNSSVAPRAIGQIALTPIIGVPGYPVSAALTGEIFVEPILARWLGRSPAKPPEMQAVLSRKLLSPLGDDEYVRVTVGKVGGRVVATPLSRGAGVISSLVRADGIVRIPRFSEGVQAGEKVTVHLYREPEEIENTIVAIGSHDLILDLMAQYVAERAPGHRLSSANVGSLGGLVALRRGEAHLAGSHLLDSQTGDYNLSYVRQYLPGVPVVLVTLVGREQGLLVLKDNPKGIAGLADLTRPDVSFVNRQRGAGTRVLLDYEIGKLGINAEAIRGYDREEYTHLAVAAAVASGVADCGLGIRAAATALDLDFVPLSKERYDLVVPADYYDSPLLQPLLALMHDPEFRAAVSATPGYDVSPMGQVVHRD
jgi:putative molybdopterin biosynthesis protein